MSISMTYPDAARYRSTMGIFATGVAVVTTYCDDQMHGMTINSLTSVSLDPCLLLICPRRGSATGNAIAAKGQFAVNLLGAHQEDLARRFVGTISERFTGVEVSKSRHGLPLLAGALAHLECEVQDVFPGGDHDIIVGKVMACTDSDGEPLVFYKGTFGKLES